MITYLTNQNNVESNAINIVNKMASDKNIERCGKVNLLQQLNL